MKYKNLWLIGALIAFLGTLPILFELYFWWKMGGLLVMGIGSLITIYFIEKENDTRL